MGYEGHVVGDPDDTTRVAACATSMAILSRAHDAVGGPVVSAGGTGTYLVNQVATEIQAGSYVFSDTAYRQVVPEFELALHLAATVVTVTPQHVVADGGLKALGMDHGPPSIDGADVWFCSDEHVTFAPTDGGSRPTGRAIGCWCSPPTSTRRSPTTTCCTWPTAAISTRRWWTGGPSTCGAGSRRDAYLYITSTEVPLELGLQEWRDDATATPVDVDGMSYRRALLRESALMILAIGSYYTGVGRRR